MAVAVARSPVDTGGKPHGSHYVQRVRRKCVFIELGRMLKIKIAARRVHSTLSYSIKCPKASVRDSDNNNSCTEEVKKQIGVI